MVNRQALWKRHVITWSPNLSSVVNLAGLRTRREKSRGV
jgi:hypothetical protein